MIFFIKVCFLKQFLFYFVRVKELKERKELNIQREVNKDVFGRESKKNV